MGSKRYAVIVAGGSGLRMGSDTPKQFLLINGKPILMHTINAFSALIPNPDIVLVLPHDHMALWKKLCEEYGFNTNLTLVTGGNTRFQSVKNGLSIIPADDSLVAIHDGVRPLVSPQVIENCYATAEQKGNAIPVITPVESVRIVVNNSSKALNRSNILLVQTPQVFRAKQIKECYNTPEQPSFTDDASVVEHHGIEVHTCKGNRENIKITTAFDLLIADMLLTRNPF